MDVLKAAIAAKRKAAEEIKESSGKKYVRRGEQNADVEKKL